MNERTSEPLGAVCFAAASLFIPLAYQAVASDTGDAAAAFWSPIVHPGPHHQHAVAYDTIRGRMVLFGGWVTSGYDRRTHEWDGDSWHRVDTRNPPYRGGHALTYDSVRERVVLFGGMQSSGSQQTYLNDTWEWDGVTWTQVAATGPSPRGRHAMTFDAQRGRVVLFGGHAVDGEGGVLRYGDTWEWDGTGWTQVADEAWGPGPRSSSTMVFDSARGRSVLFGGANGADHLGDTWEWDGTVWSLVTDTGPPCRAYHAMTYDSDRGLVVLFGGASTCVNFPFVADQQDTWEWDGQSWTQVATGGPFKRRFASLAYDTVRQRSVLFGGWPANFLPDDGGSEQSDLPLGDLWEWNGQNWVERVTTVPRGRYGHRMAYDSVRDVTVLFGGRVSIYDYETETWEWDGQGWTLLTLGGPTGPDNPRERGFMGLAYDPVRHRTWMFGGALNNAGSPSDETWSWDGESWALHEPATRPSARYAHNMVYDTARDCLVVFGGIDNGGLILDDTWEFDGTTWELRSSTGPAPRFEHGMAYDAQRQRIVLFGGSDSDSPADPNFDDTWEWDGNSWVLMSQGGPAPRASMACAYDSARGRVVIRGGLTTSGGEFVLLADTWEWDGSQWALLTDQGPGPGGAESMVYETSRERMFLFGGTDGVGPGSAFLDEMWTLSEGAMIPAISTWGAIVMALMLLLVGTCRARRVAGSRV